MKKNVVISILIVISLMLVMMLSVIPSMASQGVEKSLFQPTQAPLEVNKGYVINEGDGVTYDGEVAALSTHFAKIRINWAEAEPEADGEYVWSEDLDDDIAELVAAGTEPIMVFTNPPSEYLRSGTGCQPLASGSLDEAADFAEAVAAYYDDVNYYIIFEMIDQDPGEPNRIYGVTTCYEGFRLRYKNLFEGMYDAIKLENASAEVYVGQIQWDDCDDPWKPAYGDCDGKDALVYYLNNISDYSGFTFEAWFRANNNGLIDELGDINTLLSWADNKADNINSKYIISEFTVYWPNQYWYCDNADYDDNKADVIEYAHNACGEADYCDAWIYHQLPYSLYQNYGCCTELLEDDGTHTDAYDMFKTRPEND